MKMGIIFSAVLWGSFFILLGLSVILKHTLHIDIPVARIFFGLFLVYLGVQIITGGGIGRDVNNCDVVFSEGRVTADSRTGEYNVIFGKGLVDLTGLSAGDKGLAVKVNTIFGSSTIKLKAGVPARLKVNSAFGGIRLPNGNNTAFGTTFYQTKSFQEGKPCLEVEVNAVFGGAEIVEE